MTGHLGGRTGIAPRLYLKKLVAMLDKIEEHAAFDPAVHWKLDITPADMSAAELEAAGLRRSVDDIELDLGDGGGGGGAGA